MTYHPLTDQPTGAEVLVVGGGIVGMSLARDLQARGRQVLLVDRARLGSGSTSLNAGGVRHQFFQEPNIRAASTTVQTYRDFRDRHGIDIGFRQVGYLLMFATPGQRDRLEQGVRVQNALGVDTRMVSVDEIADIAPDVDRSGIIGACFGPHDGYFDPPSLAAALREVCLREGVPVLEGTEVTGVETSAEKITAVVTPAGRIEVTTVVNAAGAWAPALAGLYGSTLPITPRRSQVFVMEGVDTLSPDLPHTFDTQSRFYLRRHGTSIWSGAAFKPYLDEAPATQDLTADWTEAELLATRVGERVPSLRGRSFTGAWAGVIEVTADDNPIIGFEHYQNCYVAAGFSGHGMCVGPGLASSMGAEICEETPEIPLDGFRLARFGSAVAKAEGLWLKPRPSRFEEWAAPADAMAPSAASPAAQMPPAQEQVAAVSR